MTQQSNQDDKDNDKPSSDTDGKQFGGWSPTYQSIFDQSMAAAAQ